MSSINNHTSFDNFSVFQTPLEPLFDGALEDNRNFDLNTPIHSFLEFDVEPSSSSPDLRERQISTSSIGDKKRKRTLEEQFLRSKKRKGNDERPTPLEEKEIKESKTRTPAQKFRQREKQNKTRLEQELKVLIEEKNEAVENIEKIRKENEALTAVRDMQRQFLSSAVSHLPFPSPTEPEWEILKEQILSEMSQLPFPSSSDF